MEKSQLVQWGQDFESKLFAVSEGKDKKVMDDGSILIGHTPKIAKYAYTHKLFAPMGTHEVLKLENKMNLVLPKSLLDFYSIYNGCSIFCGGICIFGVRESNERDIKTTLTRPFDIVSMNLERSEYARSGQIIVGFFKQTGALIVMNLGSGVFKIDPKTKQVQREWESIFELLEHYTNEARKEIFG